MVVKMIKKYLWGKGLKKGAAVVIKGLVAWWLTSKGADIATQVGVTIDLTTFQTAATVGLTGVLHTALNWIKVKTDWSWL